jgi:glycolate oxidase FAD binding subunit
VTAIAPRAIGEVVEAVGRHDRVRVRGGGSKTALSALRPDAPVLELGGLAGIVDYEPSEYTFTALAGTPVRDIEALLAERGQSLPFDPPLAEAGATLGGTVAAGLSGSGRYRYGGVRDFILGVRFVDGRGRLVRGGGRVVKNAAGFDLPKLLVGSLGRLGVLVEATFKVFPRPEVRATLRRTTGSLEAAVALVRELGRSSWDLEAVDIALTGNAPATVDIRLAGLAGALPERLARLRDAVGGGDELIGVREADVWTAAREFTWVPAGTSLVKVPVTPARIGDLERALAGGCAARRYAGGGQVVWLAWTEPLDRLDARLREAGMAGLVVRAEGPVEAPLLGATGGGDFGSRVKQAIDPDNRFGPWERPGR